MPSVDGADNDVGKKTASRPGTKPEDRMQPVQNRNLSLQRVLLAAGLPFARRDFPSEKTYCFACKRAAQVASER